MIPGIFQIVQTINKILQKTGSLPGSYYCIIVSCNNRITFDRQISQDKSEKISFRTSWKYRYSYKFRNQVL